MSRKLNFSLTQLEYVQAVARHGHFGKAAESCHVTQPTLSMQVQKLEEDLGVTIFDRSKKPILLTHTGQKLLEQVQAILAEAKQMESLVEVSKGGELEGSLAVGVIPTVAPDLLPRLLPAMEKHFPKVELNLMELQTHRIVEALNSDEIDVGLLAIPLKLNKISERSLYFEPFSVLCHRDHELARERKIKYSNLRHPDIWLLQEGHCLRHQVLDVCDIKGLARQQRKFHFESGSLETLKNLVSAYGGYTLLPALSCEHLSAKTKLIPFERPIPVREIGLAFRRKQYKVGMIEALAEAIKAAIPAELRTLRPKDLDVVPIG